MEQIARELNLSRATVYRVINGKGHVRSHTRERVEALVRAYNYYPNLAAQNLVNRRTRTIGVLVDNLSVSVNNEMVERLVRYINERSYRVILQTLDLANFDAFLGNIMQDVMGNRIDGLIADIDPVFLDREPAKRLIETMRTRRFPFVVLSAATSLEGIPFVATDRNLGTYKAVRHLIKLGRRRIAFVSNGFHLRRVNLELRLDGYFNALKEAGIRADRGLLVEIEGRGFEDGLEAGVKLANMRDRVDGVFCINDEIAVGAVRALSEAGVRVPEDMAVVGFDNSEFSAYAAVPLTTVAQPIDEIAKEGVRLLYDRIEAPESPVKQLYLEPRLIVRASCGGVPAESLEEEL